jgi:UDPglucose--hexose-1-phosphate uridylyltransferase
VSQDGHGGPEFRLDPLTRKWVAITAGRQKRPNLPVADCPFCIGGIEAPDPYVVKAFPNRWPPLEPGDPLALPDDPSARVSARGAAEVVLYSSDHNASLATLGSDALRRVIDLWAERSAELLARPEVEYVLVFENRGAEVGATIRHPHGQIYAFPFVPSVPAREAEVAAQYGCPVCHEAVEALDGERLIQRNDSMVAFAHPAPAWPFEVILAPLEHVEDLASLGPNGRADLADVLSGVLARYDGLFERQLPYMFWVHPGVHLHIHVVTPYRADDAIRFLAAGELGSGVMFNPVTPESAGRLLRAAVAEATLVTGSGSAVPGHSDCTTLGA